MDHGNFYARAVDLTLAYNQISEHQEGPRDHRRLPHNSMGSIELKIRIQSSRRDDECDQKGAFICGQTRCNGYG